eukprot:11057461-Ditylum_brightwellii.AAC.1
MIFTAINRWSAYMLPIVSNIATYNLHDGSLDAQLVPSVVKFNTIQTCQEVKVSNIHVDTKYNSTDGTTKGKGDAALVSSRDLLKEAKITLN